MEVKKSILDLVGNTPILQLGKYVERYTEETGEEVVAQVFAKLEYLNPAGSIKDRVALEMILDAEEKGILKPGATIIEPTSGNTGIGLACVAVPRGYRVIIVMPDTMSRERRMLMTAYGAELVLTDGKKGMGGAIEKAKELEREIQKKYPHLF